MNEKLLIDALKEGTSDPAHLEICVRDYTIANESSNYSEQFKNLEQLVRRLNQDILAKLDSSSTSSSASNPPRSGSREARQEIHEPPVGFGGHGGAPIHPSGVIYPPVNPVGDSDLFPGPPAGVYPTWGDPGTGGSMLVGPNDPRWFGGESPFPGGQPGVPPGVPLGARFDPFGPPDVPGFEPNRFQRGHRGKVIMFIQIWNIFGGMGILYSYRRSRCTEKCLVIFGTSISVFVILDISRYKQFNFLLNSFVQVPDKYKLESAR
ncbi:probable proteasome inhibitor isoform X3 [Arachis duranensis]|uniref:Probable proteasome inhibitor isoform X3 n=1 Tax=Arachis duranensis TaxID=130453 RepID=A0A9C6WK82_ARADU|nr:probable proteasome inhibitor isoform X3 [Arachis duranensis]